jgi:putative ABC transport system permease protein
MLRNYLKIALRMLWKHRTHTLINGLGLAVAFGCALLLGLTSAFELSYDRFHPDHARTFKLYFSSVGKTGELRKSASMPYPMTPALKADFPEIEAATAFMSGVGGVRYGDKAFSKMVRLCHADFLRVFSFPLLKGDARTALNDLSSIVISEHMAKAVFGTQDPLGKAIQVNLNGTFSNAIVTGIIGDFPDNSSIQYDALMRIENSGPYTEKKAAWDHTNHEVYVKLAPNVSQATLEKRLEGFLEKYQGRDLTEMAKTGRPKNERGRYVSLLLMPLADSHFDLETVHGQGISKTYVYTLLLVGLLMLLIAGINFVNLTVAQAFMRAREVGVRKSLGALRGQLMGQIWGETALLCLAAVLLGGVLAYASRGTFNTLFRAQIRAEQLSEPGTLVAVGVAFLLIVALAGGYPSWVVARFNTVAVLKGGLKTGRPGLLRSGLIVVQFAIASLLTVCTLVMVRQHTYLREAPLGYSTGQVISVPVGNDILGTRALQLMRDRLAGQPNVLAVTGTGVNIGAGLDGSSSRSMYGFNYGKDQREVRCDWLRVDFEYLKVLDIKLLQGRDFDRRRDADSSRAILITQSFAKQLGEKDPLGKFILPDSSLGRPFQVVGVVNDFNLYSLHQKAEPIVLQMHPRDAISYVLVRVGPQNLPGAMETVKAAWKTIAPKQEFEGSFLDENTDRWYRREARLSKLFMTAAGIAIFLSCMGLFAIAVLRIEQRTKEIGVRKVLGASIGSVVLLLNRDFLALVLLALVVASPVAWYVMTEWLGTFAYHVAVEWWIIALAAALAIGIALLTVSFQSIRAALMNPVKSLRTE